MGVASRFNCWWCSHETSSEDLRRLDSILSFSGKKPGVLGQRGMFRICTKCMFLFDELRSRADTDAHRIAPAA